MFIKSGNIVGGVAEWICLVGGQTFIISYDVLNGKWVLYVDGVPTGEITDGTPTFPPSGDWGLGYYVNIAVFTGTLQQVLEQLGTAAVLSLTSSNISYNNNASGLTASDVKSAIDELALLIPTAPTTAVVDISSAQILAMGTTPIELLPAPGANKYYVIDSTIIEYASGNTDYTFTSSIKLNQNLASLDGVLLDALPSNNTEVSIVKISPNVEADTHYAVSVNSPYYLHSKNVNPTLGNKTFRAIITYTVRTFGA